MTTKTEIVLERLINLGLVSKRNDGERWITKEKIPDFGDKTAAELIILGRFDAVLEYIERIADGGFA